MYKYMDFNNGTGSKKDKKGTKCYIDIECLVAENLLNSV